MRSLPSVSVIIPTHNRPELLLQAIQSVAAQTTPDWQAIIVDDASWPAVDGEHLQAEFGTNLQVIRHPAPLGGAAAKNTGIKAATGTYLAFLDDDDLYHPSYLETATGILRKNPQFTTLFMGVKFFGTNEAWEQDAYDSAMLRTLSVAQGTQCSEHLLQFDRHLFPALLESVPMAFQRPVTTLQHFLKVGMYQPDCLLWDCDWALRATLDNVCGLFSEGLYLQRVSGQSWSSKPSRRLEHGLSALAIKQKLLLNERAFRFKQALTISVKQASRDVAWEYITHGHGLKAIFVLLGTARYGIDLLHVRFLLRALFSCIIKK